MNIKERSRPPKHEEIEEGLALFKFYLRENGVLKAFNHYVGNCNYFEHIMYKYCPHPARFVDVVFAHLDYKRIPGKLIGPLGGWKEAWNSAAKRRNRTKMRLQEKVSKYLRTLKYIGLPEDKDKLIDNLTLNSRRLAFDALTTLAMGNPNADPPMVRKWIDKYTIDY